MIFYLLQQSSIWNNITGGKRNARVAIVGAMVYILLYILVDGVYRSSNWDPEFLSTVRTGMFLAFAADLCVMGWIYKDYYGRSIVQEVGDKKGWVYDENHHKYHYLPGVTAQTDQLVQQEAKANLIKWEQERKTNALKQAQVALIQQNKKRLGAVRCIQKWWRRRKETSRVR